MRKEGIHLALDTLIRCLSVREIPKDLFLDVSRSCSALEAELAKSDLAADAALDTALGSLLYAVGQSVENGAAAWEIEDAYEDYEKAVQEAKRIAGEKK